MTAACAGHPHPEWFDSSVDGETPTERHQRHAAALAVCAGCPVTDWCRDTVDRGDDGVRGGELLPHIQDKVRKSAYVEGSEAAVFFAAMRGDEHKAKVRAPRVPQPPTQHGRYVNYRQHLAAGESPCGACRDARKAYDRERRRSA